MLPLLFFRTRTASLHPMARLRVLHIASWYPSEAHGTLGNFVQRHVEASAERVDAEVWYVARGESRIAERTHRGVKERIAYVSGRLPWFVQVTCTLLRMAKHQARPDAIHLHVLYPAGIAARLLARRWGVPLIATEHWTVYHRDQRAKLPVWRRLAIRWAGRGLDRLCPVTSQLGESLGDFGIQAPVHVVPNVVDTTLFKIAPRTAPPVLLHISSLADEQKNVTGLIECFGLAADRLPAGTTLHIIGDGDPAPHAATAERLGLSDRILTGGEIPLAEVAERMAAASAVLLFSRFENFPCVIPEAWAAGTPVVVTDVGGIREHVPVWGTTDAEPERGACVASEDAAAFVQALLHTLEAAPDRGAMRRYAEARFSVAAIGAAFEAVYTECLGRG